MQLLSINFYGYFHFVTIRTEPQVYVHVCDSRISAIMYLNYSRQWYLHVCALGKPDEKRTFG